MTRNIDSIVGGVIQGDLEVKGTFTNAAVTSVTDNLALSGTLDVTGAATAGTLAAKCLVEAVTDETEAVSAAESGKVYVQTRASTTTTYTLPAAAAGLTYTFVCGHASGETLITPAAGDAIVGKTHGAENGAGIAPAAGTGIKNTAASNVVGDHCTLVALDDTTWYMTSVAGVWASQ